MAEIRIGRSHGNRVLNVTVDCHDNDQITIERAVETLCELLIKETLRLAQAGANYEEELVLRLRAPKPSVYSIIHRLENSRLNRTVKAILYTDLKQEKFIIHSYLPGVKYEDLNQFV